MTFDNLRGNPKAIRLLYQAVAEFSDACDLPDLNPSCPFFMVQADGSPICAEECRDVLGEDLAPAVKPEGFQLGHGLEATRRPRPRRKLSDRGRPFDAREEYLRDKSKPLDAWSVPALLVGLAAKAAWMLAPDDDHTSPDGNAVMEELTRRGLKADRILRLALRKRIFAAMIVHILVHPDDTEITETRASWTAFARKCVAASEPLAEAAFDELSPDQLFLESGLAGQINHWIATADTDIIFAHTPPAEPTPQNEILRIPQDKELNWLHERFTETYLEKWSLPSLVMEWRYIHSQRHACCAPVLMRERPIDVHGVAKALAELRCQSAEEEETESTDREFSIGKDQFMLTAQKALEAGDRANAVATLRVLLQLRPGDSDTLNNLGFCLLPDSPEEAGIMIQRALEASYGNVAIARLNLAVIRYFTGDASQALKEVEKALAHESIDREDTIMWSLDGEWTLTYQTDLREYARSIEDLAAQVKSK